MVTITATIEDDKMDRVNILGPRCPECGSRDVIINLESKGNLVESTNALLRMKCSCYSCGESFTADGTMVWKSWTATSHKGKIITSTSITEKKKDYSNAVILDRFVSGLNMLLKEEQREVFTREEIIMRLSIDWKMMTPYEAETAFAIMLENGYIVKTGAFYRAYPIYDIGSGRYCVDKLIMDGLMPMDRFASQQRKHLRIKWPKFKIKRKK